MEQENNDSPGADELVRLNYFQWKDDFATEKLYEVISETPAGLPRHNFAFEAGPVERIRDLRGQRHRAFTLDDNGFQVVSDVLGMSVFDEESIDAAYLPSVKALLEATIPGAEVYIFDWAANQSPRAALKRVSHCMGGRAEELVRHRVRLLNVWRPLRNPVIDYPLAVCDGSTVPRDKLVEVDHVRKYYVGESLYALKSPSYRWYYLDGQTKDEVLVFKNFDSRDDVAARCCPHTSYSKSNVPRCATPRESIEVRALVFSRD